MKKIFWLFALLLIMAGCTSKKQESDKKVITVTIEPLRYFTEAIAGDKYEVVSMVPEGNSPETYDPTPQQLVNLSKSIAYIKIGYIGFEQTWMEKLKSNNPDMKIFDTSVGVDLIKEKDEDHGDHHHEGGIDPHIWDSTINANIIASNIYDALCTLDPQDKEYFNERFEKLKDLICQTDTQIRNLLSNADSTFMIYHPALSYYAREYGLEQICIEEAGKEPSPSQLKALIDKSKIEKPKVIFVQKEFDTSNAQLISNELGLKLTVINPLSYNWEEEMIKPAKALQK